MKVVIKPSYASLAQWTARYVCQQIHSFRPSAKRPFVLGLPTGTTPMQVYQELVSLYKNQEISFKHVVTFNMDEYLGIGPYHPESYHHFMHTHFFDYIDIPKKNIHIPNGLTSDPDAECANYEALIQKMGPIHLFLAGIGVNGHLAFNEPGSSLVSRTRLKTLSQETIQANMKFFNYDREKIPHKVLTVGIQTIMDAQEVLVLASGYSKSLAIQKIIEEGISHLYPASALQMHAKATIACDIHAAFDLKLRTVEYFHRLERSENSTDISSLDFSLEKLLKE